MPQNKIRVVVDTNIWISFLIGQVLARLSEKIIHNQIVLLFSEELLNELISVLQRPKFSKYFSNQKIRELVALIHLKAKFISIERHFFDCRDKKDNFLLDLCYSGRAEYLITGDQDLLELNSFHQTTILDYRTFEKLL